MPVMQAPVHSRTWGHEPLMRIVTLILFIVLILLQFKLWLGEGGFREVARLETRVEEQRQQNGDLLQRNAELQAEVEDLRERLDAVEERARNELGHTFTHSQIHTFTHTHTHTHTHQFPRSWK